MSYTIKQLADLANISVRTLHHYDAIGLLAPARIKANNYREYDREQLQRLQQILFYKELDFSLHEIKQIIDSPQYDMLQALYQQKQLLEKKHAKTAQLLITITNTINAMTNNKPMPDHELYDPWQDEDVKNYQTEASNRWGDTKAYQQSMKRVKQMTKMEMKDFKVKQTKNTQAIADAMHKGITHPDVQQQIQQAHDNVNFFYDCSSEMFRGLGDMYITDPRFTAYYEKFRPGLAQFMHDAIEYYCDQVK